MTIYKKNLQHIQDLQKRHYYKVIKSRSYVLSEKVWLNSKYTKIKQNRKLKTKFFGLFWILYLVGKQAYKIALPKKWTIYDIFHILLLKQDITSKKWVNKTS